MSYHPIVEEIHQPMYVTAARGVGPVALGTEATGDRRLLTGLAIMGGAGLLLLLLTQRQRKEGFLTFNAPCRNC
jgi:hypothetical protein